MPTPTPIPLRPGDIYPNLSAAALKKWLGPHKPLGFRVPEVEEYFVATTHEERDASVSSGLTFTPYKCYSTWRVPTPRFIISMVCWRDKKYA